MQIIEAAKSKESDTEDTERDSWRQEMRVIQDTVTKTKTDRQEEFYKDEQIDRFIHKVGKDGQWLIHDEKRDS